MKKKAAKTVRKRAPGRPVRTEARSRKPTKPAPRARKKTLVEMPEPVAAAPPVPADARGRSGRLLPLRGGVDRPAYVKMICPPAAIS